MSKFVHLHTHSEYSLLGATCRLEELVKKAQDYQMPALALTDMGNLFGAIEFYDLCVKSKIKPIIGVDAYVAPESRFERATHGLASAAHTFVLLAKNETGYRNLIQLVSRGYTEGFYYKPRIDKELLAQYHDGLIGLSGALSGEICHQINVGQIKKAREAAAKYQEILGKGNFYLEVMDVPARDQERLHSEIFKISKDLGIPVAATSNVHYMERADAHLLEVLNSIQSQGTLQESSSRNPVSDYFFKSPDEMIKSFADNPEVIKNTLEIAEKCNLKIDLNKIHLPFFEAPKGLSQRDYLRQLTTAGVESRYGKVTPELKKRVDHELQVIANSGYDSYFLIVWDFVRYAREKGIPVGPGRGSAAGSVVSYALGITDLDPLKYDLLFERFLNPERVSMPDIDIDFCFERRDEVIKYVTDKYSKDNVAQIITFGTMMAKGVIRDVGRVLGVAYADVDRIAKLVPAELNITIKEALEKEPQLKQLSTQNPQYAELIQISQGLEGLSRHASTHAAGVVISQKPLIEHVPIFKTGDGQISTMYPMGSLEKIGLLKMDFLGLRTLTVLDDTIKIIKRIRKKEVDLRAIPLDDKPTFEALSKAHSTGVFQLESGGMRDILRKLKPDKFEDLIAVLALFRPGPIGSGMVEDFIKRKNGSVKIVYDHPLLEPILRDTYGVIVYQEQIMKIVNVLAGFSLAQADSLRRAISKKKPEIIEEQKKFFTEGCVKNKIDAKTADKIFQLIMYFAGYGFNKSHSAAYALISFQTAYLKTHYTVEFMTALLSSEKDNTDKVVQYIDECKRIGIEVLPPDVNESFPSFTVVGLKAIRFGLAAVKNVGQSAIDSVIQARIKSGRFTSLHEFTERVDSRAVNRKTIESLIKCGAFDSLGLFRSQLTVMMDQAILHAGEIQKDRASGQMSLFDVMNESDKFKQSIQEVPQIPEWSVDQKLGYEKELLGFFVTGHPLDRYKKQFQQYSDVNCLTAGQRNDGEEVMVGALVNKLKLTVTKAKNERMAIVTLEDLEGSLEALVFPRVFAEFGRYLVKDATLFFKGRIDRKEETPKLIVKEIHSVSAIESRMTRGVFVKIPPEKASEEHLQRVQGALSRYSGPTPVYLRFLGDQGNAGHDVIIDRSLFVQASPDLVKSLEDLLGQGAVQLQV